MSRPLTTISHSNSGRKRLDLRSFARVFSFSGGRVLGFFSGYLCGFNCGWGFYNPGDAYLSGHGNGYFNGYC
jgi:hypothetical protein